MEKREEGKIRISALADIHLHEAVRKEWGEILDRAAAESDILVLAGDLTNRGLQREAEMLAESLRDRPIPVVAVLGNHDYEADQQGEIVQILCDAGVLVLDEEPHEVKGVGFAGVKGFAGGFDHHALMPFGEPFIKQFVREAVEDALKLESGLSRLRTDRKIAVLHYSPIRQTVEGEPLEIYPFLGSSRLADPLDHFEVTAAVHGHAHHGAAFGKTPRGVPVYNVSLPLIRETSPDRPFVLLEV